MSQTPSATPTPTPITMTKDDLDEAYEMELVLEGAGYKLMSVKERYRASEKIIIPSSISKEPSVSPIPVLEVSTELLEGCTNATEVEISNGLSDDVQNSLTTAIAGSAIRTITVPISNLGTVDFSSLPKVVNVNLLANVNTLGGGHFKENEKIENVVISGAIREIGSEFFYGCTSLKTVTFDGAETNGDGFYIRDSVFEGCTALESIDLTHVAEAIPLKAFSGCSNLSQVVFPQNGYRIDQEAFAGCSALRSVDLSNATSIGKSAFTGCELTEIQLPMTMYIDCAPDAFVGCTVFDVESPYVDIETGLIYTINEENDTATICSYLYKNVAGSEPKQLSINDDFYLQLVDDNGEATEALPFAVNAIPEGLFESVEHIGSISLPSSLTSIGACAFKGCSNLIAVYGGENVTYIGEEAFADCTNLTVIWMNPEVETTTVQRFIILPKNLETVGEGIVARCTSLTGAVVHLPQNMGLITKEVLLGVTGDDGANITGIVGMGAYSDPEEEPTNIIAGSAFAGMTSLTHLELHGVSSIGASAFENCTGLKEVVLDAMTDMPEAPTIGAKAFYNCSAMTKLDATGNWSIGENAFYGVSVPYTYEVTEADQMPYVIITGCSIINQNPISLEIPSEIAGLDVLEIGAYAFYNMTSITEVTLGENVKEIGTSAFYGCTSLQTVHLPNSLQTINEQAFNGCTLLQNIQLPNTLQEIGDSAFSGCTSLAEVQLSNEKLTKISTSAFSGCTSLAEVQLPSSLKEIGTYAFNNCTSLQTIELPDTLEKIGSSAFSYTALTEIQLPDSLMEIGSSAFSNTQLSSVVIPNGVTSIGKYAFENCANLSQIVIPASVTTIERNVFALDAPGSSNRLLTTYLYKELDEKASLNSTFASSGNVKVYAVSGSTNTCVTNPIAENRIVKLGGASSMAHDALELEIMQDIGAIDAQYLIENDITIYIPEGAVEFAWALIKRTSSETIRTDVIGDDIVWTYADMSRPVEVPKQNLSDGGSLCLRYRLTEGGDYIYLVTPKLKLKVEAQ